MGSAKYHVYDDFTKENFATTDKDQFINRVKDRIAEAPLTKVAYYSNPLDHFIVRYFPGLSFDSRFIRWIFGQKENIYRNHHRFVVLTFAGESGETFCASVEKGQTGIVLQIAEKSETVAENRIKTNEPCDGIARLEPRYKDVREIWSTDNEGWNILASVKPLTIEEVLEKVETGVVYKLFEDNCQSLVNEVNAIRTQISEGVKIKFCGSGDLVSLGEEGRKELCDLVDKRFPNSVSGEGGLTTIPEDTFPHTLVSLKDAAVPNDMKAEYEDLQIRDMVNGRLNTFFKSQSTSRLFFNNLYQKKMSLKLNEARLRESDANPYLTEDLCQKISNLWTMFFDGVIMSETHGIVILQVRTGNSDATPDDRKSSHDAMEARKELMVGLLKLGLEMEEEPNVPISSVIIKVGKEREDVAEPNEYQYEFSVMENFDLSEDDQEHYLENNLKNCLDSIKKSTKNLNIEQLKFAAGKLLALQYLENADVLLHERIAGQKWIDSPGPRVESAIIWSKQQQPIIDEIRLSFRDKKQLRMMINGCPGSGKTFILIESVVEYLSTHQTEKVLFVIPATYSTLKKQIRDRLEDPRNWEARNIQKEKLEDLRSRIIFKEMLCENDANNSEIGLIAFDEFGRGNGVDASILKKTQSHFIGVSMLRLYSLDRDLEQLFRPEKRLGGSNYRSSPHILKVAVQVQRKNRVAKHTNVRKRNMIEIGIEMDAKLSRRLTSNDIKKYYCDDDSDDRSEFVRLCVKEILELRPFTTPTLVYNYCHSTLLHRVQESLEKSMEELEFKHLYFLSPKESQGAEFSTSIGLIDPATIPFMAWEYLFIALTRAFRDVHFLINRAQEPCTISGSHTWINRKSVMFFNSYPEYPDVVDLLNNSGKVKVWCEDRTYGYVMAQLRLLERLKEPSDMKRVNEVKDADLVFMSLHDLGFREEEQPILSTRASFIVLDKEGWVREHQQGVIKYFDKLRSGTA